MNAPASILYAQYGRLIFNDWLEIRDDQQYVIFPINKHGQTGEYYLGQTRDGYKYTGKQVRQLNPALYAALMIPTFQYKEQTQEQKEFEKSLKEVIDHMTSRFDRESMEDHPFKEMFEPSEQNLRILLSDTNREIGTIVSETCNIIKEKFGLASVSDRLYSLIKALPYASHRLREHIYSASGNCCVADKMRDIYYQEVLEEIERLQNAPIENS